MPHARFRPARDSLRAGGDGPLFETTSLAPICRSHRHDTMRVAILPLLLMACVSASSRSWMDTSDSPQVRAHKLVQEMTTDEKIELFHGSCGGYTGNVCANARLGIPQIKMNDGPQGFRGSMSTSTAFPAAITIAATWDVNVAQSWGAAMGDEFYRKGANVQLGPGLCVARVPRNGEQCIDRYI